YPYELEKLKEGSIDHPQPRRIELPLLAADQRVPWKHAGELFHFREGLLQQGAGLGVVARQPDGHFLPDEMLRESHEPLDVRMLLVVVQLVENVEKYKEKASQADCQAYDIDRKVKLAVGEIPERYLEIV